MKKLTALLLAIMLVAAMPTTVFAASITTAGGSNSADVTGSYEAGSATGTVYSVEVSWGSMAFTYTGASTGTWNPDTHAYSGTVSAAWSCAENANKITVTNHSNKAVAAALTYSQGAGYSGVTGAFNNNSLSLATAVGTKVASAPSASALLTLTGELASSVTEAATIGSVTVSIT